MLTKRQLKSHFAGYNAITPHVIEYGHSPKASGLIYELSSDTFSPMSDSIYGVTVRKLISRSTSERVQLLCQPFSELSEAYNHIKELCL